MQTNLFHRNIPERLTHLRDLPFAYFVGVSPAGVDWVAYRPENVKPMRERLKIMILKDALAKGKQVRPPKWI